MLNRHALTGKAGAFVFGKVDRCCEVPPVLMKIERRLEAIFAEYGASDPNKLPRALQREILQRAIVETAVDFPAASGSFMNLGFIRAWERMWLATQLASDAFAIATGVYAAVVLAGFGLPVAPFDLVTQRILAKPSNDIDTVWELFASDQGAVVGYDSCSAPFYLLVTDCIRSLRRVVSVDPRLSEVKLLFERAETSLPADPGQSFVHGVGVVGRQPGDKISTVGLHDPNPTGGSLMLHAGWRLDGQACGAPNDGYMPMPAQLLRKVVHNPAFAYALSWSVSPPPTVH
jgi:hypothetical protein